MLENVWSQSWCPHEKYHFLYPKFSISPSRCSRAQVKPYIGLIYIKNATFSYHWCLWNVWGSSFVSGGHSLSPLCDVGMGNTAPVESSDSSKPNAEKTFKIPRLVDKLSSSYIVYHESWRHHSIIRDSRGSFVRLRWREHHRANQRQKWNDQTKDQLDETSSL